jgi:hypothetical protein
METCYKLVRTDLIRQLGLLPSRFEMDPEITAKILKRGYQIKEVPISYKSRLYRQGKKIGWKDGVNCIACLFKLRLGNG